MLKIVGTLVKISVVNNVGVLHFQQQDKTLLGLANNIYETIDIAIPVEKLSNYKKKINQRISIDVVPELVYYCIE